MKDKYKLKEELRRYRGRICEAKMRYDKDCTVAMLANNTRFLNRACDSDYKCPFSFGNICMKVYYAGEIFEKKVR